MNSEAVQALIAKNLSLKAAKAKLESMEPGAYCIHRSWGFGQIRDYDEADEKLVIDFKGKKKHRMDPAFCVGTLDILPARHPLVRKETEPEKIAQLINEKPVQLVVENALVERKVVQRLELAGEAIIQHVQVGAEVIYDEAWCLNQDAAGRVHAYCDDDPQIPLRPAEIGQRKQSIGEFAATRDGREGVHRRRGAARRF